MNLSPNHIAFESKINRMVGLTLQKAEYLEINYQQENPKPFYSTKFNKIDTIDYSIIFHTDKDKIEIFWDEQFFQFGLGFRFNEVNEIATGQKWNVSQTDLWAKFIGQKITEVWLTWEEVTTSEKKFRKPNKYIYPQDLRIDFSNNKSIFISAAQFLNEEDKEVMGMSDNLTVTDNELMARQVKMIN